MLRLSGLVTDVQVLSLRTGGSVATAHEPIINPNNLKIEGWYCTDRYDKKTLILLSKDLRDFVSKGLAINDYTDLSDPEDLIRLKEIMDMEFILLGKPVVTDRGRRIGKVTDYAVDSDSLFVEKLYVARPVYKSLTDGQLSIDRKQIVEITHRKITVREPDIRATDKVAGTTSPATA